MMQLLLKIDKKCDSLDSKYEKQNAKLDEQQSDSNVKYDKIISLDCIFFVCIM